MNICLQRSLLVATFIAVLILLAAACDSSSSAQKRPLTAEEAYGRDLYQAHCAICHNAYKKEPLQGPPLVGVFRKDALPSGIPATDAHVRDTIMLGRRNMPVFNGVLNEEQLHELMAYLHTL